MAKMHKDYTIADMLRLGGAWVKTYKDIESLQKIAGTLAMMDKGTTDVTIERFMLPDKSIESDVDRIKAICLSLDGTVHTVSAPVKLNGINKALIESKMKRFSSAVNSAVSEVDSCKRRLVALFTELRESSNLVPTALTADINPTEVCTFKYFGKYGDSSHLFVQTVPTNLSRVNGDGAVDQRCLGRYVAVIDLRTDGAVKISVGAVVDGLYSNGHVHPNVRTTGIVCFGEGNALATTLEAKGDIVGLLALLDRVLRTSQYGSPYEHLSTFNEKTRSSVIATGDNESLESMLMPLSLLQTPPVSLNTTLAVSPIAEVRQMFSPSNNGTVEVEETADPDIYLVSMSSSVLRYAPRSMFVPAVIHATPSTGVHRYSDGGYAVDGDTYGNINIYEQPMPVDRLDTDGITGMVHGICIVEDEMYKTLSKYIDGVMVAAFAYDDDSIKRVTTENATRIYQIEHADICEQSVKKIVDLGNGLAVVVGTRVIAASVEMNKVSPDSVIIIDSMNKYWFK